MLVLVEGLMVGVGVVELAFWVMGTVWIGIGGLAVMMVGTTRASQRVAAVANAPRAMIARRAMFGEESTGRPCSMTVVFIQYVGWVM